MNYFRKPILLLVILSGNLIAAPVNLLTHSLQGQSYVDENGELRGIEHAGKRAFNIELVREMMKQLGQPNDVKELPLKEAMKQVLEQSSTALFSITRSADREHRYQWVGPLQTEADYFYEMKSSATGIQNLEDAKMVAGICVLNGSIHESILRKNNFTNFQRSTSYFGCFEKLKLGKVSLTLSSDTSAIKKARLANLDPLQLQKTQVKLLESVAYIALSKDVSVSQIKQWQDVLDNIKQSGKYKQLFNQFYLER